MKYCKQRGISSEDVTDDERCDPSEDNLEGASFVTSDSEDTNKREREEEDNDEKDAEGSGKAKKVVSFLIRICLALLGGVGLAASKRETSLEKTDDDDDAGVGQMESMGQTEPPSSDAPQAQDTKSNAATNAALQVVAQQMAVQAAANAANSAAAAATVAAGATVTAGITVGLSLAVAVAITAVVAASVATRVAVSDNRNSQRSFPNFTDLQCGLKLEQYQGRMSLHLEGIARPFAPEEVKMVEDTFVEIYNSLSGACRDIYERNVTNAQLADYDLVISDDGTQYMETEWDVYSLCNGCSPREPLFNAGVKKEEPTESRNAKNVFSYRRDPFPPERQRTESSGNAKNIFSYRHDRFQSEQHQHRRDEEIQMRVTTFNMEDFGIALNDTYLEILRSRDFKAISSIFVYDMSTKEIAQAIDFSTSSDPLTVQLPNSVSNSTPSPSPTEQLGTGTPSSVPTRSMPITSRPVLPSNAPSQTPSSAPILSNSSPTQVPSMGPSESPSSSFAPTSCDDVCFDVSHSSGTTATGVEPFKNGQSLSDVYGFSSASYQGQIVPAEANTSRIFFHVNTDDCTMGLVVIIDAVNGTSGSATLTLQSTTNFDFSNPTVKDDSGNPRSHDNVTNTSSLEFGWAKCCTDGFGQELALPVEESISINANFSYSTITCWEFHRPNQAAIILDAGNPIQQSGPLTITRTRCYVPSDVTVSKNASVSTDTPSGIQTEGPTETASDAPSVSPSDVPLKATTIIPAPSVTPASSPSFAPKKLPSAFPSTVPSDVTFSKPSSVPSDEPSGVPSESPTIDPSNTPSLAPSEVNTSKSPSETPSSVPSLNPSVQMIFVTSIPPSDAPSNVPTNAPSNTPNSGPTGIPSFIPSGTPTDATV